MQVVTLKTELDISGKRSLMMDVCKMIASIGVIVSHVPYASSRWEDFFRALGPTRVPFFLTVSITYFIISFKRYSSEEIVNRIFVRLILPYLAWSVIYILLLSLKSWHGDEEASYISAGAIIFGQSSVQLYFIPMLVMMQFFALGVYLVIRKNKRNLQKGLFFLLSSVCLFSYGRSMEFFGVFPVASIIIYLVAGYFIANNFRGIQRNKHWLAIGAFLMTATTANFYGNFVSFTYEYIYFPFGGFGLALIVFSGLNLHLSKWVTLVSSTSFGIYLSHIFFWEGFEQILHFLFPQLPYNGLVKVFLVFLVILCSISLTLILRQNKITRLLFLGEGDYQLHDLWRRTIGAIKSGAKLFFFR